MIKQTVSKNITEALKMGDKLRLETYRMLLSEFNYEKIRLQHELTDNEELAVVAREAKKRKEAIDVYKNVNAQDRQQREEEELKILEEFLPEQIGDLELDRLIDDTVKELGAKDIKDMGRVIAAVKQKTGIKADGSKIAMSVRKKLVSEDL